MRELDLTGQARIALVVCELGQQLALIRHRRRQLLEPLRIDVHVARRARAHPAADRGDAVVELAQRLHDLQTFFGVNLMLDSIPIDDSQQRHVLAPTPLATRKGAKFAGDRARAPARARAMSQLVSGVRRRERSEKLEEEYGLTRPSGALPGLRRKDGAPLARDRR